MTRRALITGITGQDGSYLAEHLLKQGYEVWGLVRGQANPHKMRVSRLMSELSFVDGDLMDQASLVSAVDLVQPDEVYNLGAISFVPMSWQQAELVTEVNAMGVLRVLEAIRIVSGLSSSRHNGASAKNIRFYQASSSEMYGKAAETPQRETTIFHPRSPYGVAKAYGHFITRNYRESFGMYAVGGILFNHESPRRGAEYYVVGTGEMHSVRDAVRLAFEHVGLNWEDHVYIDPVLVRPAEVEILCADTTRVRGELGWKPEVDFSSLMKMMVEADLKHVATEHQYGELLAAASW
jgi:GDPmannose 4,6-dehydratase